MLKIVTSVAPYVTAANALEALALAHEDGFAGVELSEDHIHCLARAKPGSTALIRQYSDEKRMSNSLHKSILRPSIDATSESERIKAVVYTFQTLDYMEECAIPRMVLHSFSDLPALFAMKDERASRLGYAIGSNAVKVYGVLAPVLRVYRKQNRQKVEDSFKRSLSEIAKYAADKRVNGHPIEIVFEEHYSDAIDYEAIPYGRGNMSNVIRGIDTAHHLIRTGKDSDLSQISDPIHFHAVDTDGLIDDHRTLGKGKVNFKQSLSVAIERRLTDTVVLENGERKSALASRDMLASMIKRVTAAPL